MSPTGASRRWNAPPPASLHHGGAHLLRLRHRGQYRVEKDARQRMAAIRADLPASRAQRHRPGFAGVRATHMSRSSLSGSSKAKTCWSAPSTSRATARDAGRSRRDDPGGLNFVPAGRLLPCTNCGMAPLDRSLASASSRRLPPAPLSSAGRRLADRISWRHPPNLPGLKSGPTHLTMPPDRANGTCGDTFSASSKYFAVVCRTGQVITRS